MGTTKEPDIDRVLATMASSSLPYRSFATEMRRADANAPGETIGTSFPLLAAALPEMATAVASAARGTPSPEAQPREAAPTAPVVPEPPQGMLPPPHEVLPLPPEMLSPPAAATPAVASPPPPVLFPPPREVVQAPPKALPPSVIPPMASPEPERSGAVGPPWMAPARAQPSVTGNRTALTNVFRVLRGQADEPSHDDEPVRSLHHMFRRL